MYASHSGSVNAYIEKCTKGSCLLSVMITASCADRGAQSSMRQAHLASPAPTPQPRPYHLQCPCSRCVSHQSLTTLHLSCWSGGCHCLCLHLGCLHLSCLLTDLPCPLCHWAVATLHPCGPPPQNLPLPAPLHFPWLWLWMSFLGERASGKVRPPDPPGPRYGNLC